jgi:hypothetical protein
MSGQDILLKPLRDGLSSLRALAPNYPHHEEPMSEGGMGGSSPLHKPTVPPVPIPDYQALASEADKHEAAKYVPIAGTMTDTAADKVGQEAGNVAHDINLGRYMMASAGMMGTPPSRAGYGIDGGPPSKLPLY